MKRYLLAALAVCAFLGAMCFGIIKKQSYTNLVKQTGYLEHLMVAEIPENIALETCSTMQQDLPKAPIILRVKVTGKIEHLFQVDRQKAVVQEVCTDSELSAGDEIYLFSDHWQLILSESSNSISRGFVNIMEPDTEYLIFAEKIIYDQGADIPSVKVYDDFFIAPVFCYENHQNTVIPVTGMTTYVPYKDVKNNEFFAETEEAMLAIQNLKMHLLQLYPR